MNFRPLIPSRRAFLAGVAGWSGASALLPSEPEIPMVDYHVHLDDRWGMTLERALQLSQERNVKFGLVVHAGTKDKPYTGLLSSDGDLRRYLAMLGGKPVYKGVQAEGLDWMTAFSPAAVAQLDYVLSDALTLPEKNGSYTELWRPWVKVADAQEFMERYTEFNVQVISREPIDILANPLYLPECLKEQFDALWTPARMKRIAEAAAKHRVAIELNERFRLPHAAFIKMAREAGAKFSFGSNHHGMSVGRMDYSAEVIRKFGLKPAEVFQPAPFGQKPVQIRKF